LEIGFLINISKLTQDLLSLEKDLEIDLLIQNETHSETLEKVIINILKNESIENKICDLYSTEIKDLDTNNVNKIILNVNEIINKIKENIINEGKRLSETPTSYTNDYSSIVDSLNYYKNNIFDKLNSTIFTVLEGFYANMIKNVSNDYIVSGLNEYIKEVEKVTSRNDECKDYSLLSSSYNIGKIIDDL